MESLHSEFALYGIINECARTKNALPPRCEVHRTNIYLLNTHKHTKYTYFRTDDRSKKKLRCWVELEFFGILCLKGGCITIFNIWTISPIDIGICGKMFKKYFLLTWRKWNKIVFRIEILLHLGVSNNQILLLCGVSHN